MAVATSFPYAIKIPSSQSQSSSSSLKPLLPRRQLATIRSYSQAEGPIRRPMAPQAPMKPNPPKPIAGPPLTMDDKNVVTLEFQRVKAKELQEYFKTKKLEQASQGPFFGFVAKNEIGNGRWAMFGFAVGLLTEYATGSDLVDQVKILLSNFGILDLE